MSADVKGELLNLSPYIELKWSYNEYTSPPIKTNMLGKYNYFNFLAAISAGVLFDIEKLLNDGALFSRSPRLTNDGVADA